MTIQEELKGKQVSLMEDSTPFHGELFATIARYVKEEPWKVEVVNRLIDLFPAQSSLNALGICHIFQKACISAKLNVWDVKTLHCDTAPVNLSAYKKINEHFKPNIFIAKCCGHLLSNSGDLMAFPLVEVLNTQAIKVFAFSDNAKAVWQEHTSTT